LKSREFLADLLFNSCFVPNIAEGRTRALQIIPYIECAIDYLEQSLDGKRGLSYLTGYYGILSILKVYILTGKYHSDLRKNHHHGASYKGLEKDSRSILTEYITIKEFGAIPLFYRTITGEVLPKNLKVKIGDILPYLPGVSYEYELASGRKNMIAHLGFANEHVGTKLHLVAKLQSPDVVNGKKVTLNQLRVLRQFKKHPLDSKTFVGPVVTPADNFSMNIYKSLNNHLAFRSKTSIQCAISSRRTQIPQELPTVIFFYYMSNVVRYKPTFFQDLRNSKFWPLISAAQKHSLQEFMIGFWCYLNQTNIFINE
jgi:hypothetical protein